MKVVEPDNIFSDGFLELYLSGRYAPKFVSKRMMQLHDQNSDTIHEQLRLLFGSAIKCYACGVVLPSQVGGSIGTDSQTEDQDQAWGYVYAPCD